MTSRFFTFMAVFCLVADFPFVEGSDCAFCNDTNHSSQNVAQVAVPSCRCLLCSRKGCMASKQHHSSAPIHFVSVSCVG